MYTSDTRNSFSAGLRYLAAAAAVAAAGQIYELFSHGVYSNYMVFAFMIPLAAGAIPDLIAAAADKKRAPLSSDHTASGLQLAAVATLTAGSLVKGALDIYGTTNRLTVVYPAVGIALLAAALLVYVRQRADVERD